MPRAFFLVWSTVFVDMIGFGIVLPLLPSYAAAFQVSPVAIGTLVASFSLTQVLLAAWWGRLSDRIGRRPVLLVGLAGSTLSYLLFAVAGNFWLLLLSRVVAGGMGATVNVAQAYLADLLPPAERPRGMGLLGAAFGLGFVVGPALGGVSSHFGDHVPGILAACFTAANLAAAWRWLPESRAVVPRSAAPVIPAHWSRFRAALGAIFFSTVAFTVLYVVFPIEVQRHLGYGRDRAAYLFVLIGLVSAGIQGGLIGRLSRRFGERQLLGTGGLLLAGGLALIPSALARGPGATPLLLLGALGLLAAGSGMIAPSAAAFVSRMEAAEGQGRSLGLLQSTGAAARVAGPLLAGAIATGFGARAAFYAASVMAGLAALSATLGRTDREPGASASPG